MKKNNQLFRQHSDSKDCQGLGIPILVLQVLEQLNAGAKLNQIKFRSRKDRLEARLRHS